MKIIFTTIDGSRYQYNIVKKELTYESWLETLEGNRNAEFRLSAYTPTQSVLELKPILNEMGIIIKNVDTIEDSFHPKKFFQELMMKIEG